jgi:serine/threonine protein kinase
MIRAHLGHVALVEDFGILHRDLSPSNFFISYKGTGQIADFNCSVYINDQESLSEERMVRACGLPPQFVDDDKILLGDIYLYVSQALGHKSVQETHPECSR